MKKKIVKYIVIIALFLALVPFPQKIKCEYYGTDVLSNKNASITVDMIYLRFLLLKDKLSGEIVVTSENETVVYGEHMNYSGLCPTNNADKTMHAIHGFRYDLIDNQMMPVSVYLSRDFNRIAITDREPGVTKQYIGNIKQNKIEETVEFFSGFIEINKK